MSRSKRTAADAAKAAPAPRQGWLLRPEGGLRTGWLLAVSLFGYVLAALVVRGGLTALCARLFEAWGIDAENAYRAPGWARLLYVWHGSLITVTFCGVSLALCKGLRRLWHLKTDRVLNRIRSVFVGFGIGAGLLLLWALLCLLPDSLRLRWPLTAPALSWRLPILLAVSLAGALAEEVFTKRVLYDGLKPRWGTVWATVVACAVFFAVNAGYSGNLPCAVNVLLLGFVCCRAHEKHGLWRAVGLRWGWAAVNGFLLGFGGGESAVYRLYGVSENLLTGGDFGPVYGLWVTALLLVWLAITDYGLYTCKTPDTTRASKGRSS